MYCTKCGAENRENMSFCKMCGAPLKKAGNEKQGKQSSPNSQTHSPRPEIPRPNGQQWGSGNMQQTAESDSQGTNRNDTYNAYTPSKNAIPEEYTPISMWGYFGYELLFSVPLIGLILLLVFSFGGTKNKNLKNFARSYFCFMIVIVVITVLLLSFGVGAALHF